MPLTARLPVPTKGDRHQSARTRFNRRTTRRSFHTTQLFRLYKDGEEWKRTASFGRNDLPLVVNVADHGHLWILEAWKEKDGEVEHPGEPRLSPNCTP
ncbi:MAG: hypothetical protein HY287_17245 [Planctomycetes bacterium]|nr:hypothetical protein [Planctomycetota bacterium]MBI3836073.1 hypothetical protein [Planctomycetota bacterium]